MFDNSCLASLKKALGDKPLVIDSLLTSSSDQKQPLSESINNGNIKISFVLRKKI